MERKACPSCGASNPLRYRLCGACGAQLEADRPPDEIRRFATVVNSDLKGSTALGERLDPESLRGVLSRYFDEMRLVFESHGGTIEKIIGDAIVAVFGLPVRRDDDAIRAVEAAAESLAVLAILNDQLDRTWGVRLVNRTGVSSGEVVVGEATAGQHVLTGDTMRISSAMEQNAPPLEVLIAGPTYELVREFVEVEPMPPVTPKGGDTAIPAYRLISVAAPPATIDPDPAGQSEHRTCPTCGAENEAASRLCGTCGSTLAGRTLARESRKTVTLVFADPKPTPVAGEPPSAEALRDVMSRYFEAMRAALERHGGTVEKFIGDAVMAVFGLPVRHEDDAIRAVRAAADMQAALPALNDDFRATWGLELRNHIGVNTGEVIAGDASTGQRLVTGDAVNTAARLEQAAGPAEIILGDLTYRLARDEIEVEAIPPLTLKGKAEPVPAYRLVRVHDRAAERRTREARTARAAPFVGREIEMARLTDALAAAGGDGHVRLLTVVGDAGVGKSRLIAEFAAAAGERARVVRGRCLPYGDGITFWPLAEVVRDAAEIGADDTPDVAVERVRTLLAEGGLGAEDREAVADRVAAAIGLGKAQFPVAELFWGARRLLESLAIARPLVMIVDDIHSAEATFLDLLDHLVDEADAAPILILCSARHELADRHPEWSEAHADRVIDLRPLSEDDAGRMIGELLGQAGLDASIVNRIVGAAEGNPLFVEQMVSMLVDNGTLRREDDRWVVASAAADIVVPPTIHALLAARLDALAAEDRAVVEPASIVGLVFAQAAVESLVDEPVRPIVPDRLGSLARKQFVRADSLDNEAAYRFGHQLIRDTAYGSLLKRERVLLHERFVEWAERVNRERGRETEFEEILGYHLEQAYRYRGELGPIDDEGRATGERAAVKLASAGRRALARGDMPAAASLLRRSVALLPRAAPFRIELLVDLGEALLQQGAFEASVAVLDEAGAIATEIGDERLGARVALLRVAVEQFTARGGSAARALDEAQRAIEVLEPTGDDAGLARAWRLRMNTQLTLGHLVDASAAADRVIEHANRAGDQRLASRSAPAIGYILVHGPTPVSEAIRRCEELLAGVSGDRKVEAVILSALAQLRAMEGAFEVARDLYRRGQQTLAELGGGMDANSTSIDSSRVELLAGAIPAAKSELLRDYEALAAIDESYYRSTVAALLAQVSWLEGSLDEALRYSEIAEELADADDVLSQVPWRAARAKVLTARGRADDAVELARSAVTLAAATADLGLHAEALIELGTVLELVGRGDESGPPIREALSLFEQKGDVVSAERTRSRLAAAVPR